MLSITGTLASTVGQINPFRYRGYYYDNETGWYYLQSRYYDPVVGRFLNADNIIGANGGILGYNMFACCNNNPVMGYDPRGREAVIRSAPKCDEKILKLIENADLDTTARFYSGDSREGEYYVYTFSSESKTKYNFFCFGKLTHILSLV